MKPEFKQRLTADAFWASYSSRPAMTMECKTCGAELSGHGTVCAHCRQGQYVSGFTADEENLLS